MESMIYIFTGTLSKDPKSGSTVRPIQMLDAFRKIGFDVALVSGYSLERKRIYTELKKEILSGNKFAFCYMETTTMPMALGDPGHLPSRPFMDIAFMRFLRKQGIPVSLFYRDVYWNFPTYGKSLGVFKRAGARLFYKLELRLIYSSVSRLYLGTKRMADYLPGCPKELVAELPPGCVIRSKENSTETNVLNILYVGGVKPPYYDISDMLSCVRDNCEVRLTIVCRKEERFIINDSVSGLENIRIEHRTAKDLPELYEQTHIAMIFNVPTEYLSFAMPIKLFEAIGFGVPVLARHGTAVGDFVAREGVGWVLDTWEEARDLLHYLHDNPAELYKVRERALNSAGRNTWEVRARCVAQESTNT